MFFFLGEVKVAQDDHQLIYWFYKLLTVCGIPPLHHFHPISHSSLPSLPPHLSFLPSITSTPSLEGQTWSTFFKVNQLVEGTDWSLFSISFELYIGIGLNVHVWLDQKLQQQLFSILHDRPLLILSAPWRQSQAVLLYVVPKPTISVLLEWLIIFIFPPACAYIS